MGLAVAIATSAILAVIAWLGRPLVVLYALTFIIVFFEELGTGFTSFHASIFFNQDFIRFFNFKFIEIIIAFSYPVILLTYKPNPGRPRLTFEKRIAIAFISLVAVLCLVEYWIHGRVTVSDWRVMVAGLILFHMMAHLVDTEQKMLNYAKALLVMMGIRALIGLAMMAAGHGVHSPRGTVPFFWDSRQVDGFALGFVILSAYLIQYRMLPERDRILNKPLANAIVVTLGVTVLLSIRRSVWFVAAGGAALCLFAARRVSVGQILSLASAALLSLVLVMTLPGLQGLRDRIGFYVESMNIFESDVASQQQNATHIDNVYQYSRIIMDEPEILYLGFRGRSGENYWEFSADMGSEFRLGKAHNGLLRTILFYGLFGLFIYLAFYLYAVMQYRKIKNMRSVTHASYIAMGSMSFLLMELIPALVFVPPFFTSIKGNYYTFVAYFLLRSSLHYAMARTDNRGPAGTDLAHQGKGGAPRILRHRRETKKAGLR